MVDLTMNMMTYIEYVEDMILGDKRERLSFIDYYLSFNNEIEKTEDSLEYFYNYAEYLQYLCSYSFSERDRLINEYAEYCDDFCQKFKQNQVNIEDRRVFYYFMKKDKKDENTTTTELISV